jgi:hypothetical protein
LVGCLGSEPRLAQSQSGGMRLLSAAAPGGGECGPCPDFSSYTLAFALQLKKNHGETLVRVTERRSADRRRTRFV